jgi:hypothetical protein
MKEIKPTNKVKEAERKIISSLSKSRSSAFARFPLLFTLLGAFGLVATFYGFERLIDQLDVFSRNPIILLATGIATLLFTGTLYKKL